MTKIFAIAVLLFTFQIAPAQEAQASNPNLRVASNSVAATAGQLTGKWQIAKVLDPKKGQVDRQKIQGSYLIFGTDQKYAASIMGGDEKGEWQFGPENRSIQLIAGNVKGIWNILSISDTELVIQRGSRGNTVTLTR